MSTSTKRVHFASTNRVYSPIPTTPSPCASNSSLPSTPDLPTPPPELDDVVEFDSGNQYPRSPYPQNNFELFLQEVEPKDMHIHSFLAYSPYQELETAYDLSQSIHAVKALLSPQTLMEAATHPPLQSLTIVCPDYLPWDIPVKASNVYPGAYVTVDDVLTALYTNLRLTVNPLEYERLGPLKQVVDQAYFARIGRVQDAAMREQEAKKGVKRVDFLRGVNMFMGLSGTHGGSDVWELNVS